jgi:hypothetical protein
MIDTATRERLAKIGSTPIPGKCGTRGNYRRGCKCLKCRAANSQYEVQREAAKRSGDTRHLVSAATARARIIALGKAGVGYKIVAEEVRMNPGIVLKIRQGKRANIRAHRERAILAIDPKTVLRGDHSLVDGAATWRLIDELLGDGYTKRQIATWFYGRHTLTIQFRRDRVTFRTAAKIQQLYADVRAGKLRRDR